MSKRQVLMLLGILIMILFFLGFPEYVREIIAIVAGLLIVFIAYRLKPEGSSKPSGAPSYVESRREPAKPAQPTITVPEVPITSPNEESAK